MRRNSMSAILSLTDASNKDLLPMTRFRPVAALPIAARYRAIDISLSSISHAGIHSVAMFIGGSGRSIYDHIRSGTAWDLESNLSGGIFTYSQTYMKQRMGEDGYEDGDFYVNHREFIQKSKTKYVVIFGGKILCPIDLNDLQNFHVESGADMTVTYKEVPSSLVDGHPYEKIVKIDKDQDVLHLVSSDEMAFTTETVNQFLNINIISVSKLLEILTRASREGIHMDIDRLVAYYSQFYQVKAYEYKGPLANLDSIEAYYQVNMDLLEEENYKSLFYGKNPIITKAKSEPPAYYCETAEVKNSLFATGCYIEGTVDHSVVFRKVNVEKNAEVRHSILMQGATIKEGAIVEYCILDKDVVVEPGVVIRGTRDNLIILEKNEIVTESR